MANPWKQISLDDYESHMKLDSVRQLQTLNQMMAGQLADYPAASVVILGIAGGNGLEHLPAGKYSAVYGVDVNPDYLQAAASRFPDLTELQCLHIDLLTEQDKLPQAEMLIADLLVEYIGCDCFRQAVQKVQPTYVSCIIQINGGEAWISDSTYLRAFDGLESVRHTVTKPELVSVMQSVGFGTVRKRECPLPNGKKLLQLDFQQQS